MRRRIDVDLRYDRLLARRGDSYHTVAVGAQLPRGRVGAIRNAHQPRSARWFEQGGGRLTMASEPLLVAYRMPVVEHRDSVRSNVLSDYWTLTKPEINFLIGLATAAAFVVGCGEPLARFPWVLLVHTLLGTVLVASGAGTLNQLIERQFDGQMRRTARRPIAAGRIEPVHALIFGTLVSFAGGIYLALAVRPAASLLALLTLGTYLFFYTPLKRRTPLCTLVGAFPGAMPVLIGYIGASGKLDSQAWLLYAILFLWQFPHFMAIAWMYREDYARAGYA